NRRLCRAEGLCLARSFTISWTLAKARVHVSKHWGDNVWALARAERRAPPPQWGQPRPPHGPNGTQQTPPGPARLQPAIYALDVSQRTATHSTLATMSSALSPIEAARAALSERTPIVLVTGRAGTGKSHFIRALVNEDQGVPQAVLAPTGLAAMNIG